MLWFWYFSLLNSNFWYSVDSDINIITWPLCLATCGRLIVAESLQIMWQIRLSNQFRSHPQPYRAPISQYMPKIWISPGFFPWNSLSRVLTCHATHPSVNPKPEAASWKHRAQISCQKVAAGATRSPHHYRNTDIFIIVFTDLITEGLWNHYKSREVPRWR